MIKYHVRIDGDKGQIVDAEWVEESEGCLKFFVEDKALGGGELVAAFTKYDNFIKVDPND